MQTIIDALQQTDVNLLLFLNGLHTPALDPVMYTLTGRFIWVPFYALLAFLVWRRLGWRNAILAFLLVALTITLADQICGSVIRPLAARMRPSNPDNPISEWVHIVNGYRGGRHGMASCHAANCFALAAFLTRTLRWRLLGAVLIFAWAAVVVYTRIYLGVHYPGDIVVGGAVGISIALATSMVYHRIVARQEQLVRLTSAVPLIWSRLLRIR